MQDLGAAAPAIPVPQLIELATPAIGKVMSEEMGDDNENSDRVWILRKIDRSYVYYRDLQYSAPALYQSILDFTSASGNPVAGVGQDADGMGMYDYTQNLYKGYCRKLEAVLGNRMPNAIAIPDNADDAEAVSAASSANAAAVYIRQKCDLQLKNIYLVFGLFNFGTMFWHIDWVVDGEKNGYKTEPVMQPQDQPLGNAAFNCPTCGASLPVDGANPDAPPNCQDCGSPMQYQPPTVAQVPAQNGVRQIPKGKLEITLHDASEITVPLDATCIESCDWLRWDRENTKARLLKKNPQLREKTKSESQDLPDTPAAIYAEAIRSRMASPIGLIRPKRSNRWTESDTWWVPAMYELIDDKAVREAFQRQFPTGVRITSVRGQIVDLKEERLCDRWQECKPEPSARIMADALGDDWLQVTDICNNLLNQRNETVDRSNLPGFGDPTRIDFDAWETRRNQPVEMFPALRPAGGRLEDIVHFPAPATFSEQIQPFRSEIEGTAKNVSGLEDPIWGGGDAEEPTARQAELKKNAALMQLGVPWSFIGKSLEHLYQKACRLLAEFEDGVLAFSQKNQFGRYSTLSVVVDHLRNGKYHFEADEAIPMTWGQMRDLIMWMLDKPAPLLELWGMNDPLNIPTFKRLLGMPGERTPLEDDREKGMDVIMELLNAEPVPGPPGPPGPDGQPTPGPQQSSIQPDWEDNHDFCAKLARAYLTVNSSLKKDKPNGYLNVQLWGQAQESAANAPPPKPPVKASVAVALKGEDLGDPAVQAALTGTEIIPQGTPVQAVPKPLKMGEMPPPGGNGIPAPAPPIQ